MLVGSLMEWLFWGGSYFTSEWHFRSLKGDKTGSLVDMWEESVPDRDNSQCKGPKVRVRLVCGRNSVAWVDWEGEWEEARYNAGPCGPPYSV